MPLLSRVERRPRNISELSCQIVISMPVFGTARVRSMLSRINAHALAAYGSSVRCLKFGSCTHANGKSPCPQRARQSAIISGSWRP